MAALMRTAAPHRAAEEELKRVENMPGVRSLIDLEDGKALPANLVTNPAAAAADLRTARRVERETWLPRLAARSLIVMWSIAFAIAFLSLIGRRSWDRYWSLVIALGFVAVVLTVIGVGQSRSGGFLSLVVGKDRRLSTSKTQAGLWTVVAVFTFAFFGAQYWLKVLSIEQAGEGFAAFDERYLLLVGGPFAAAVLAKLATNTKTDNQTLQKTEADGPQAKDIVADDAGNTNLIDTQYLLFNVLAVGVFAVMLVRQPDVLPSLPSTLVGLTSLAAGTYVANKAIAANKPLINSIVLRDTTGGGQAAFRPNSNIEIRGVNFIPPGAASIDQRLAIRVRFDTVEVGVPLAAPVGEMSAPTDDSIHLQIPQISQETVNVVVVTAAGLESNSYPLRLATGQAAPAE
jgi:hypothetical protein